jgi:hypothetical protein
MNEGTTVARELVERLWTSSEEGQRTAAEPRVAALTPSEHIVHQPDLAYLNRRWIWASEPEGGTGGSPLGLRRRLKAAFARLVMGSMARYFVEERAFIEHLVRFQNDVAKKSDRLSDELREVAAVDRSTIVWMQDRLDELSRRNDLLHCLLEARVERLEASRDDKPEPLP